MEECFRAACDIKSNVEKISRQSSRNPNLVSTAGEVASKVLANVKSLIRDGVPAHEVLEAGRSVIDDANIGYKQGRRIWDDHARTFQRVHLRRRSSLQQPRPPVHLQPNHQVPTRERLAAPLTLVER